MAFSPSPQAIAAASNSVQVRILAPGAARTELFELRHKLYVDAGFLPPSPRGAYRDRYDDLPSTINLGLFDGPACRGGLRLCISGPDDAGSMLPCGQIGVVRDLKARASGAVVELSRLVVEPSAGSIFYRTSLTALLIRSSLLICKAVDAQYALIAARPMLVPFYRGAMGLKKISGPVRYPPGPGDEPVILMAVELAQACGDHGRAYFDIQAEEVCRLRRELGERLPIPANDHKAGRRKAG